MKKKNLLFLFLFVLTLLIMAISVTCRFCQVQASTMKREIAKTLKVGIYRSRPVALAWGRSDVFKKYLDENLTKKANLAKQNNDENALKELDKKGNELQTRIHEQVFGSAPIDDVLAYIQNDLPQIAQKAGVDIIVSKIIYKGPEIQIVDITESFIDYFKPDNTTRQMIKNIEKHPPTY